MNTKSLTKPPQLKLFTSKPCLCPNPRSLYFGLKPINCPRETASVVSPFQVAFVLAEKENFSPSVYVCIRTMILKGWDLVLLFCVRMHSDDDTERVGSGTPVPSTSLRQAPILVIDDQIIVHFIEKGQRGLLPPSLEFRPLELIQHFSNMTLVTPASTGLTSSSPLDLLNSIHFCLMMWIPNRRCIL